MTNQSVSRQKTPLASAWRNILNPDNKPDLQPPWLLLLLIALLTGGILILNLSPFFNAVMVPYKNEFFAITIVLIVLLSLRFLRDGNSLLNYLIICIPYILITFSFVLSTKLIGGDSSDDHFPVFKYICNTMANGHFFSQWIPLNGGVRIGFFHINLFLTLPNRFLGYFLSLILPVSTVSIYKLQYVLGVIFMCFGWWLVLRKITYSKYSAYFGTLMIMMGGTGITFHQEQVLATTYLIPWFTLSLLELRRNSLYIFPAVILFGLGLSTHYPQIQIISMGLIAFLIMMFLRFSRIREIIREQKRFVPLLLVLFILSALPAYYIYQNINMVMGETRPLSDTFRSRTYGDYLYLHQEGYACSAPPQYYYQYITPLWAHTPPELYPTVTSDRCSFFVGRIGLVLAALGLFLNLRKTLPIFILLIIFAALTLGINCAIPIPKYLFLLHFPFIDVFRQWVHFFPMVNFCLSALAALGLDRLVYYCRNKSRILLSVLIIPLLFLQIADLAAYDKKYLSLFHTDTLSSSLFDSFSTREEILYRSTFQYKNRLQLDHSCGEKAIPTEVFLTTDIINLTAESDQDIEKVCEILSQGGSSVVTKIPSPVLAQFFTPGKHTFRQEISSVTDYEGLSLNVSTPHSSLLVTPLNYDLGAKAYLDGREVKIWRINNALSGILVKKGHHRIRFKIPADIYWPMVLIQWLLYIFVALFFVINLRRGKSS